MEERTEEIRHQNIELAAQKKEITDSIYYAERIQRAILPKGAAVTDISAQALKDASYTMTTQINLLAEKAPEETPRLDSAMLEVVKKATQEKDVA